MYGDFSSNQDFRERYDLHKSGYYIPPYMQSDMNNTNETNRVFEFQNYASVGTNIPGYYDPSVRVGPFPTLWALDQKW